MSRPTLTQIADRVLNRPLMILPDKLGLIASVLDGRIGIDAADLRSETDNDFRPSPEASRFVGEYVQTEPGNPRSRKPYRTTEDGVANIPVLGSLVNRGAWIGAYSGMTSYEGLKHQIAAAARDDDVGAIVLDMDSPGGEAVGAFEVAEVVRAASERKPVIAVVNGMAASAAYAIASGASRIISTSSGVSGSIGVVMLHADYSHALHERGVKPTLIHAGARKVDGNPYTPLTDDVRAELKAEIDRFYDLFVECVVAGRSMLSGEAVRGTEARTYIGADAVKIGLADEVGSFEAALSDLSRGHGRSQPLKPKGSRMSTTKDTPEANTGITQQALDTAVAAARKEGETAGAAAAYDRISKVLGDDRVKGRERFALSLACKSRDMSADDVCSIVAENGAPATAATTDKSLETRMSATPDVAAPVPGTDPKASKDTAPDFVARMKARHGVK